MSCLKWNGIPAGFTDSESGLRFVNRMQFFYWIQIQIHYVSEFRFINRIFPKIDVCSFKADWLFAMKYAERLFNESRWSRSTYACLKASFLLMTDDDSTRDHVTYLMQYVSEYFTYLLTLFYLKHAFGGTRQRVNHVLTHLMTIACSFLLTMTTPCVWRTQCGNPRKFASVIGVCKLFCQWVDFWCWRVIVFTGWPFQPFAVSSTT